MPKKICHIGCPAIVFLFILIGGVSASQTPAPDIVILYTGDIRSEIEPSGGSCCTKIGGSSRLAGFVRETRDAFPNVLLLDTGDYLWQNREDVFHEVKAHHALKFLAALKYDVLNVAEGEIGSPDRLDTLHELKPSGIISTNASRSAGPAKWEPYVVKSIGGIKIGILGVVSPTFLADGKAPGNLTIADPKETIGKIVPEIKKQADIIVLLSHLGWKESREMAETVAGIDIVIVGHEDYDNYEPERVKSTLMVKNAVGGGLAGMIKITTDQSGKVPSFQSELKLLDKSITVHTDYKRLERDYQSHKFAYMNYLRKEKMDRLSGEEKEKFRAMTGTTEQLTDYLKTLEDRLPFEAFLKITD